jgi:16S rRNA (guanine527-N7)-methyltransferase
MTVGSDLASGIALLGVDLPADAQDRLVAYLALLAKWNRTYNLTAVRDEREMVAYHVLDSLAVLNHLLGGSLADIGSGAGLPGIPLAIARPHWRVALVESNGKKAAFLEQCKIELGLDNLEVVARRVETWQPDPLFAVVISRALADLALFARLAAPLLAPGGTIAAMKGVVPTAEIEKLPLDVSVTRVIELQVPGVEGARHLILMGKT